MAVGCLVAMSSRHLSAHVTYDLSARDLSAHGITYPHLNRHLSAHHVSTVSLGTSCPLVLMSAIRTPVALTCFTPALNYKWYAGILVDWVRVALPWVRRA